MVSEIVEVDRLDDAARWLSPRRSCPDPASCHGWPSNFINHPSARTLPIQHEAQHRLVAANTLSLLPLYRDSSRARCHDNYTHIISNVTIDLAKIFLSRHMFPARLVMAWNDEVVSGATLNLLS